MHYLGNVIAGSIRLRADHVALAVDSRRAVCASVAKTRVWKRVAPALQSRLVRDTVVCRFVHKAPLLVSCVLSAVTISLSSVSRGLAACSARSVRLGWLLVATVCVCLMQSVCLLGNRTFFCFPRFVCLTQPSHACFCRQWSWETMGRRTANPQQQRMQQQR